MKHMYLYPIEIKSTSIKTYAVIGQYHPPQCMLGKLGIIIQKNDNLSLKYISVDFLSLTGSKLRLCLANQRTGYLSNLACDYLGIVWACCQQETENGPCSKGLCDFNR